MVIKENKCDVLVIGAGPAGMMLALWLARLGVDARIIDKRSNKVFSGQADGVQARTLEIFDSFGLGEIAWKECFRIYEVCFWNPDSNGSIRRDSHALNYFPGLSRFHEAVLHQGRVEQLCIDAIKASYGKNETPITVERSVMPSSLDLDESSVNDPDEYPVTVSLRHIKGVTAASLGDEKMRNGMFRSNLTADDNKEILDKTSDNRVLEEVLKAKYVVGCDGAHSWTRNALGDRYKMIGESTDFIWGVMDIVPITDFPDIRKRCVIHSANDGTVMIIPRENRMVRLYIQLNEISAQARDGGRVDRSKITSEIIIDAARKILSPYKLEYHYRDWWTAYQIGQRIGNHFSKSERIFLAGDAVHTHSPKAGQGMNVSMQDTYNLGWKLGLVCKGLAPRSILSTYELERRDIANQLIDFDHKFSKLFTGRPAKDISDEAGISQEEISRAFHQSHMFTTGTGIKYTPSPLTLKDTAVQTKLIPGTRLYSVQILNQFDAHPWQLHHRMPSDGRFRLFVFGGNITASPEALKRSNDFGSWMSRELLPQYPKIILSAVQDPHGITDRFVEREKGVSILEVFLVHSGKRDKLDPLREVHEVYRQFDDKLGWDYDHIYVDGPSVENVHGHAYETYGIPETGAAVVVRPDGYIGTVVDLSAKGQEIVKDYLNKVLCRV